MINTREAGGTLHVIVSDLFDFDTSRELIRSCTALIKAHKVHQLQVTLKNVTYCNSCAIGALLVLSERVKGQFQLRLEDCHSEVNQLFDSGLLDRYFGDARSTPTRQSQASICSRCIGGHCKETGAKPGPSCSFELQISTA